MVACVYHRRYVRDDDRFPVVEMDATRLNNAQPESRNLHSCPGIEGGFVVRALRLPEVAGFLALSLRVPLVAHGRCATSGTLGCTRVCATSGTAGCART